MKKDQATCSNKAPKRTKRARMLARAEHVETTVQAREFEEQTLAFQVKEFVLCGLPYKPLKSSEYQRRNGNFSFRMVGSPSYGLPYGQDRLVLLWMVTAFQLLGCPEDNLIRFRSASDVIRAFFPDFQTRKLSGRDLERLQGRFERLFYTTFYFQDATRKKTLADDSFRLLRRTRLWFDDADKSPKGLWQNVLQLSPEFAEMIRTSSLPFDMQTIRGLKESPAALDLYLWLSWRSFRARPGYPDGEAIPLFGPTGLFAQFSTVASEQWKARQLLKGWLEEVKTFWPESPAELSEDGLYLLVRRAQSQGAKAVQSHAPLLLPGVSRNPPVPLLPYAALPAPKATLGSPYLLLINDPNDDEFIDPVDDK